MDFEEEEQAGGEGGSARGVASGAHELLIVLGERFAEEGVCGVGEHGSWEVVEGL